MEDKKMTVLMQTYLKPYQPCGYRFRPEGELVYDIYERIMLTDIIWMAQGDSLGLAKIIRMPDTSLKFENTAGMKMAYRLSKAGEPWIVGDMDIWLMFEALEMTYEGVGLDAYRVM